MDNLCLQPPINALSLIFTSTQIFIQPFQGCLRMACATPGCYPGLIIFDPFRIRLSPSHHGLSSMVHGLILHGLILHGLILHGLILHGLILYGLILHGLILNGLILHGLILHGLILNGLILHGLILHGLNF